jgi:transcriptional regulator GlxA family with amidase domain
MNVFKKSTGMSLGEYVTLLRLSYAQALLMKEDINILQIAMDSGFGSVSAFNKCFRKQSGMTPRSSSASAARRMGASPAADAPR